MPDLSPKRKIYRNYYNKKKKKNLSADKFLNEFFSSEENLNKLATIFDSVCTGKHCDDYTFESMMEIAVCGDPKKILQWAQKHKACSTKPPVKTDTGKTDTGKTDTGKTEPSYKFNEGDIPALYELIKNTPYSTKVFEITDKTKWTPELGAAILLLLGDYEKRTKGEQGATWNSVFGSED